MSGNVSKLQGMPLDSNGKISPSVIPCELHTWCTVDEVVTSEDINQFKWTIELERGGRFPDAINVQILAPQSAAESAGVVRMQIKPAKGSAIYQLFSKRNTINIDGASCISLYFSTMPLTGYVQYGKPNFENNTLSTPTTYSCNIDTTSETFMQIIENGIGYVSIQATITETPFPTGTKLILQARYKEG